ncbi:hypothetical protein AC249_AIPGENE28662 [Exaiptasia diaphana]|nr:hypothetical protein AC249_AIPGENE28662 [Exaiptasia diaphana]
MVGDKWISYSKALEICLPKDTLRLMGGKLSNEGRVEIYKNGTENSLEECSSTGASSRCPYYSYTAGMVCGNPPVFHQNITEMAGVITSPGYPSFMTQGDYRWTFTQNMSRGRVALYFEELDLSQYGGSSNVSIQESSSSSFSKEYTNVYRSKPGMVINLSGQLRFYSPYTSNRDYGDGRGMRVRFLVYSEPEGGGKIII